MKLSKIVFIFLLFHISFFSKAQTERLNNDYNYYFESALNFDFLYHFTIKPYRPDFFAGVNIKDVKTNSRFFNHFLNSDLIKFEKVHSVFRINPIINSAGIYEYPQKRINEDFKIGLNFHYNYKNKIFIYTDIVAAQTGFPSFEKEFINTYKIVPHYGKYISANNNELRYYSFTGEIRYRANKNISFSAGKGKHFLGNGYRSLFLSDNPNAYPYFKAEIDIWKIKYLWMFAKFSDINLTKDADLFSVYDKAAFIHYFEINLTKRINFNFFEVVVTNPFDNEGRRISYDAVYFNPVIFYRPVEFYKGTSDNSLMGIGLNIKLRKSCFLYSQFILDDMVISTLRDGSGWWGNKFGIQAGAKIYNLFKINGLFARGEVNIVRPYTYSHGEAYTKNGIANLNYGNFVSAAAHPYGANFAEALGVIRYVKGRLSGKFKIGMIRKGEDRDSTSYGGDIYKSYDLRPDNYGIYFLQGEKTDYIMTDACISYLINPKSGLMFSAGYKLKKKISNVNNENYSLFYLGLISSLFNSFYH